MAKVTIEIEDTFDGKVKVKAEPNFMTMMQMNESGYGLSSAHAYALRALRAIREAAKSNEPQTIIHVPRIG